MGIFTLYFAICLFGLIIRGYYRVPQSCIIEEVLDKDENKVKSIIADRIECRCHYANFLWHKPVTDDDDNDDNHTIWYNSSHISNSDDNENRKQIFEPRALVSRLENLKENNEIYLLAFEYFRWFKCSWCIILFNTYSKRIFISKL